MKLVIHQDLEHNTMEYNVKVANQFLRNITQIELKLLRLRLSENIRKVEEDQAKIAELEDQILYNRYY